MGRGSTAKRTSSGGGTACCCCAWPPSRRRASSSRENRRLVQPPPVLAARGRGRRQRVHGPTFDRWLYVKLHALKWMGEDVPWLTGQIKPGMTVVDAGANIGYYSLLFADLVGPKG